MKKAFIFILLASFTACKPVEFYTKSKEGILKKTAFPLVLPEPYLLVQYYPEEKVSQKATIIYLPSKDTVYLKLKCTLGSSNVQFDLSNGYLTSFGSEADTKIPETISALGTLLSATGMAGFAEKDTSLIDSLEVPSSSFELYKIINTKEGLTLKEALIE